MRCGYRGAMPDVLEQIGIAGTVIVERYDEQGRRTFLEVVRNLITDVGDQFYAERGANIGPPDPVSGMRLGTDATAPAKFGAGAAIGVYVAGSQLAIDGGYPTSTQPGGAGTARRITWRATWTGGAIVGFPLREVVLTNETPLTDSAGAVGDTICRALFGPMTIGLLDSLVITWLHDLLGA